MLQEGPYKIDLDNYVEHLWDNGKLERHEKSRLKSCIEYAVVETWRDTLEQAAKLVCPLCHSGHKVYFDNSFNYYHTAGEFFELKNPCDAAAIRQKRNNQRPAVPEKGLK